MVFERWICWMSHTKACLYETIFQFGGARSSSPQINSLYLEVHKTHETVLMWTVSMIFHSISFHDYMNILKPYIADPEVSLGNAYGDLGNVDHQKELLEKALNIQDRWILDTIGWNIWFSLSLFIYPDGGEIDFGQRFADRCLRWPSFSFDLQITRSRPKVGNQDSLKEVHVFHI